MRKNNQVYVISLIIVIGFSLLGIVSPKRFGNIANNVFSFLTEKFGWFYLIAMFFFVVFVLILALSKYGKIKLGDDDSKPEYSYISWFAMLFSAGMGIGLVFWGVAEPLNHFLSPVGLDAGTQEAANFSILSSFIHWGIHPWAAYTVIAMPLAYMQFRKKKPALISSIFIPILGEERVKGPIGKFIDILAIFATVSGVATSLGLGVLQINGGLNYLFGVPINNLTQIIIIVTVTVLFMISAITGLNKGILILSNANIILAAILMVLTLLLGPTLAIVNMFTNSIGAFLSGFVRESFLINSFSENNWLGTWRIFYWAWWIAWAPFVGSFIARISKGRTIKEFILGVSLVPALGSFLWFAIFGTTAMNLGTEIAAEAVQVTETAFFVVMEHIPFGSIISFVTILLLSTFFITSADSATFVLGMMSRNGSLYPKTRIKVTWGAIQSIMAFALMFSGGLKALQTSSIVAAFPFAMVMIIGAFSFLKALRKEDIKE
ncbi:glycine betaine uptake BCCT transporter [Senegalia massiliensis]|uniref:BCCT family transporter n=1 Tax=Senegalia massiliensis TaxID=1720316 RepID=A0A845QW41_9CLOT|nr:BCCT family transporter [Senegalia massiliensis]NBI06009.1 BCCT family transporter [Senegalia massiliensis]